MVRNRVATPARIPITQFRRFATMTGRLFTAAGGPPIDTAAAAGSVMATTKAEARTIVSAMTKARATRLCGRRHRPDRRADRGPVVGGTAVAVRPRSPLASWLAGWGLVLAGMAILR